jgi:hypothetical protein
VSTPARRVYLHIGLPKTGTTSVQQILWCNRTGLAAAGLLYPASEPPTHHRAAVDLLPQRYPGWTDTATEGVWQWLVEQAAAAPADVVISSELMALARPREVAAALSALAFAEVHLVCTARDLARQIPSVWQEDVKNRRTTPFTEFVEQVRAGREDELADLFWSYQDLPGVLRTWAKGIPPQRVHVVTVPPKGAPGDLLWERFASVFGLAAASFDQREAPRHNTSLDLVQTELLRRLNLVVGETIPWPEYVRIVKGQFAEGILPPVRGGHQIALTADDLKWATEVAQQAVEEIGTAGYHVVGELADLIPRPNPNAPTASVALGDPEVADLALRTLAEIMRKAARPEGDQQVPALKRYLLDLSQQHDQVMAMRRMYWRTKARLHHATDRVRRG